MEKRKHKKNKQGPFRLMLNNNDKLVLVGKINFIKTSSKILLLLIMIMIMMILLNKIKFKNNINHY